MKIKKESIIRCVEGNFDPVAFCRDFYAETGMRIMAENKTEIVHGYMNACHFEPGYKGICKAGREIKGKHTCIEIFFYDQDEEPNEQIIISDGKRFRAFGHKSKLRKPRGFDKKKKKMDKIFKKFKLTKNV